MGANKQELVNGLTELEKTVYRGYYQTDEERTQAFGILAIAQQLSRIADAAERVAGVVVDDEKRGCSYFRVKRYSY